MTPLQGAVSVQAALQCGVSDAFIESIYICQGKDSMLHSDGDGVSRSNSASADYHDTRLAVFLPTLAVHLGVGLVSEFSRQIPKSFDLRSNCFDFRMLCAQHEAILTHDLDFSSPTLVALASCTCLQTWNAARVKGAASMAPSVYLPILYHTAGLRL